MSAPTLTDYAVHAMLDYLFGSGAPATYYLALTSGGVELAGNGYARKAITNNNVNFPAAATRTKSLAVAAAFAASTGPWNNVDGWALYDQAAGGNAILSGDTQDFGYVCRGAATGDTLNYNGHPFANGDAVRVEAPSGHNLPTGLATGTTYYVVSAGANSFQLSATQGGAAIDLTADGVALVSKWYGKTGIVATDVYSVPVAGLKAKISTQTLA